MSPNVGSYQSIVLRCGVAQAWNSFRHARAWYDRKFCVFDVPGTVVQNALFGGFLGLTLVSVQLEKMIIAAYTKGAGDVFFVQATCISTDLIPEMASLGDLLEGGSVRFNLLQNVVVEREIMKSAQ